MCGMGTFVPDRLLLMPGPFFLMFLLLIADFLPACSDAHLKYCNSSKLHPWRLVEGTKQSPDIPLPPVPLSMAR